MKMDNKTKASFCEAKTNNAATCHKEKSAGAGLNRRPLNLQSNALPLSYRRICFTSIIYADETNLSRQLLRTITLRFMNEFKHVRNFLSNTINIVLLWILQYIWTLPGFVVVLSYLYSNQTFRKVRLSVQFTILDCRLRNQMVQSED